MYGRVIFTRDTIQDSELKRIPDLKEEQAKDNWCQEMKKKEGFEEKDGLIYKKEFDGLAIKRRVCVPETLKDEILFEWHDTLRCGHLGRHKTVQRISQRFHWPKMETDIANYIRTCQKCQLK